MRKSIILLLLADILLIAVSFWLAFVLRFDGAIPQEYLPRLFRTVFWGAIFLVPIYYYLGLYSFSWSYISTRDLISLFTAAFFSFLFLTGYLFLAGRLEGFPRSVLFMAFVLVIFFTGGIRFSRKFLLNILEKNSSGKENILIIGAGDAGEQVLRNIQGSGQSCSYVPKGFIDDNPAKHGNFIHGIKVLGPVEEIKNIALRLRITGVIIAVPSAADTLIKKAVAESRKAGIKKIKILPPLSEIVNGQVKPQDIKDFKLEDLLFRQSLGQVSEAGAFLKGKKVLVTGAAGSIGSEIARQARISNPSLLVLLDQDETGIFNISQQVPEAIPVIADINDEEKIKKTLELFKPEIIFHAAAYKHVPLMESQPEEAVKNNIFGTKSLAETALASGCQKFVFISTDKAVNPKSVMGASKRIGEMICQSLNGKGQTKFVSVRFGNVLGSRGSVIPVFQEQIKKGGPVEVTSDQMRRYFMTIPEAVGLVFQAAEMGLGGEVFVLDMGDPVKILDLANNLIRLSGLEPDKDIPVVFTGARPGEKIFEEILSAEEGVTATQNKNIFIAVLKNRENLENALENLRLAAGRQNRSELLAILKQIIPTL